LEAEGEGEVIFVEDEDIDDLEDFEYVDLEDEE
jgi:GTPase obg